MKKFFVGLMVVLLFPVLALASVPQNVLHEAVLTLTWPDEGGECWVEGHVVLGEQDKGDTTEVYAQVMYMNYGFLDGVFTDAGGGSVHPAVIVFENTQGGYALKEILEPDDGENYGSSIEAMMPEACIRKMQEEGGAIRAEMERQMTEQAQSYLASIGRTEPIGDWREHDLQLSGMLPRAANLLTDTQRRYPLWLTSQERIEDGVRYVYTREWYPEAVLAEGETGTEVLTKTRHEDGFVAETITIEAEEDAVNVTFADEGGSISYAFQYDGNWYHQPVVTSVGACSADLSGIEQDIARLMK